MSGNVPPPAPPGSENKDNYVLFMSSRCAHSKKLLSKIKEKRELMNRVKVVQIEQVPQLPPEIREVPTVYDGKQVHAGKMHLNGLMRYLWIT